MREDSSGRRDRDRGWARKLTIDQKDKSGIKEDENMAWED